MNQVLLHFVFASVFSRMSKAPFARRIAMGCLGGWPARALETASRWNWRRIAPMVGVEVVSAVRATSILNARKAM